MLKANSAHILTLDIIKCRLFLLVEQLDDIWILLNSLGWTNEIRYLIQIRN